MGVRGWEAGDRVVVYQALSCGHCRFCERGEETMCSGYKIFGEDTQGGLAEYCRVPAANLESLPDHVTFERSPSYPPRTRRPGAWS